MTTTQQITKDSDPQVIDDSNSEEVLDDPLNVLLELLIYGPSAYDDGSDPDATAWVDEYAQARLNAYVLLRKNGFGGNPLDEMDIAAWIRI